MNKKSVSTTFLKIIIVFIGFGLIALCSWLPFLASKDAKSHPETAYFLIPFLIYAYGLCVCLFISLYQAYKLVTYVEKNNAISKQSLHALQTMKKCAFAAVLFILLAAGTLQILANTIDSDDAAGPRALCFIALLLTMIFIACVNVLQKPLKAIHNEQ